MAAAYDRVADLQAFDLTGEGVKGLVDAGVTQIPRFFIQPPDDHGVYRGPGPRSGAADIRLEIPLVDLGGVAADPARRRRVVDEVRRASETWGFFQVMNHGVPLEVFDQALRGVRRFFEQDAQAKKEYYTRDLAKKVQFTSNFDLYTSLAANWRDTLFCVTAPVPLAAEELPAVCRDVVMEYSDHMARLGRFVFELLSEALGLEPGRLKDMGCAEGHSLFFHYYPACPQPELAMGTTKHSDPDFLTILLQDQIGGLQVLREGQWVDVCPIPGALVVNVGDLLQLVSNDRFVSVEHRVVASKIGPRMSVACFFTTHLDPSSRSYGPSRLYGPIKDLLSSENPPVYREASVGDYMQYFMYSKVLREQSALAYLRM